MTFFIIASKIQVLRLLTTNQNENVLRTAEGDYLVRFPDLPTADDNELDIDHELCFASARLLASFIAKEPERVNYHERKADEIMDYYQKKVASVMNQIREKYNTATGEYKCLLFQD